MEINDSSESIEFKNNNKNEDLKEYLEIDGYNKTLDYNYSFVEKNNESFKNVKSWEIYFIQNLKFDFSIHGLSKLKQEIFLFYISMFCFDDNEIRTKKNYILGYNTPNDLTEVDYKSRRKECIRILCQIYKKDDLVLVNKKNDFFKLFKHYFIWYLNKIFEIGKMKSKYRKSKFFFEPLQSVFETMQEDGILFKNDIEEEILEKKKSDESRKEKPNNEKIEIINDDKIPILHYELNELTNDEKNFGMIKEFKDENNSFYQGAILNKDDSEDSDSFSKSIISISNDDNKNSNNNESNKNSNNNDDNKNSNNNCISDESKCKSNSNKSKNNTNKNMSGKNSNSIKEQFKKNGLGREYHINLNGKDDIRYKYIGYFKNNKFHCYGILIKENQECYYGEFREGKKNGFGFLFTKQYLYKGFFHDDMKEGYGEYLDREKGVNYCGNFSNDKFNGYGYYYKDNKFKFLGTFVNGSTEGLGLYTWNYQDKYYGHWYDDKMNGLGIYYYKGGDIFIGNYCDDKKDGKGKYIFHENKSILEGEWRDGIKHGKFTLSCFKDGRISTAEVKYINNKEAE